MTTKIKAEQDKKLDGVYVDETYYYVTRARDFFVFLQRIYQDSSADGCKDLLDTLLGAMAPKYAKEMQFAIREMQENFNLPDVFCHKEIEKL